MSASIPFNAFISPGLIEAELFIRNLNFFYRILASSRQPCALTFGGGQEAGAIECLGPGILLCTLDKKLRINSLTDLSAQKQKYKLSQISTCILLSTNMYDMGTYMPNYRTTCLQGYVCKVNNLKASSVSGKVASNRVTENAS